MVKKILKQKKEELSNKEKWIKSLVGGLVFTFLFFILFLITFRNTELTIFEIFKILKTSFFLSVPFYFMRRITLSHKPTLVFLINLFYGVPLLLWILYLFPIGEGGFALIMIYEVLVYYTYFFFILFIPTAIFYFYDTNKLRIYKKLKIYLIIVSSLVILILSDVYAFTPRYEYEYKLEHINETEYLKLSKNIFVDKEGKWHIEILNYSGIELDSLKIWTNIKHKTKSEETFRVDELYENVTVQNSTLLLDHGFNKIKIYSDKIIIYYGSMKVIKIDRTNFLLFFFLNPAKSSSWSEA